MGAAAYNRGSRLVSREADEHMPVATSRAANESVSVCAKHTDTITRNAGLANGCWVCEADQCDEERTQLERDLATERAAREAAEKALAEMAAKVAAFEAQSNVVTSEDRARIPKEGSIR